MISSSYLVPMHNRSMVCLSNFIFSKSIKKEQNNKLNHRRAPDCAVFFFISAIKLQTMIFIVVENVYHHIESGLSIQHSFCFRSLFFLLNNEDS